MKFAHIADLHIGKRVNEFSMLEEQRYIFKEIIEIIRHEDADAVLVAGDEEELRTDGVVATIAIQEVISFQAVQTISLAVAFEHIVQCVTAEEYS